MEFIRRRLGLIFRSLVSILLIVALMWKIDWVQVWSNVRTMDPKWLVAGFFCFAPVVVVCSWRWRMLLAVHGVNLRFWRIFELCMIGQFFSSFLLGTTGGDFVKIYYVARAVPQRRAAVAFTVIVDRVIGLIALLLFGVALSFTQLHLLLSTPKTQYCTELFYFFALGGVIGSIGACAGPYLLQNQALRSLLQKLPYFHKGTSILAAYEQSARAIGTNFLALIISIPSHICSTLMGYCVLRAMHLHPNLLAFLSIVAMVNMLIALPVTISGLGLREGLFVMFLGLLHIDKEHALPFSLTYFFLGLLWAFVSGPFYFLYRHETHTPAPPQESTESFLSDEPESA